METTNVGILNVSSESFGQSLNVELIVELVGLAVLLMMLARWLKKCIAKRKLRQRRALAALLHGAPPPAPPQLPQPPPPPPAAAPGPSQMVFPMRAMQALEYKCTDKPREELWTQA